MLNRRWEKPCLDDDRNSATKYVTARDARGMWIHYDASVEEQSARMYMVTSTLHSRKNTHIHTDTYPKTSLTDTKTSNPCGTYVTDETWPHMDNQGQHIFETVNQLL